jgi:hypothetical protein
MDWQTLDIVTRRVSHRQPNIIIGAQLAALHLRVAITVLVQVSFLSSLSDYSSSRYAQKVTAVSTPANHLTYPSGIEYELPSIGELVQYPASGALRGENGS